MTSDDRWRKSEWLGLIATSMGMLPSSLDIMVNVMVNVALLDITQG